jgi:FMN reductase
MSRYLVISTSGNPESNSRIMARVAYEHWQKAKIDCEWLDLRDLDLPLCDADKCYASAGAGKLNKAIHAAEGIIVAAPVYNYDVAATAKNMIELSGKAWEDKIVGFLCAAGGMSSYMSVMAYANSLMLDFRTIIVPRFVYATGRSFDDDKLTDDEVARRVREVADEVARFVNGLRGKN